MNAGGITCGRARVTLGVLLLLPPGWLRGAELVARLTGVAAPPGEAIRAAALADIDGDNRLDLIALASDSRRPFRRSLRVYSRQDGPVCFAPEPARILELTPDVVAFAVGDVTAEPGREIVLFTPTGAFAWSVAAVERSRPVRLLAGDCLWQLPYPHEVFHWAGGVQEIDGDGLDDLLLPEPAGYRIALQAARSDAAGAFGTDRLLALPESAGPAEPASEGTRRLQVRQQARSMSLSLSLGGGDPKYRSRTLASHESVPAPVFMDWNADGRPDLLAQTAEDLLVWCQQEGGAFAAAPDVRQTFPIAMDMARRLDVSFSSHATDLNGDGRADCVVFAGDSTSDEVRTQVLVYVQGAGKGASAQTPQEPLFGPRGVPQQLLVIRGFAGMPQLADANGDGAVDLFLATVQMTSMDAVRAAASGSVQADLALYLNEKGRFSPQPVAHMTVGIPTEGLRGAGRRVSAEFVADVTGDRLRDLLLRDDPARLRIIPLLRERRGLAFGRAAVYETRVDERAKVLIGYPDPLELLIIEHGQLLHVRFRP